MRGVSIKKPLYIQKNTGDHKYLARILLGGIFLVTLALFAIYAQMEGNQKLSAELAASDKNLLRVKTENKVLKSQLEDFLKKTMRLNQLYQTTLEKATSTASEFDAEKNSLKKKVFELQELNSYLESKNEVLQTELQSSKTIASLPGSRRQTDPNNSSITREWIT